MEPGGRGRRPRAWPLPRDGRQRRLQAWAPWPGGRGRRLQAWPPEHFLSILVASRSQGDWDVLVADVDWAVLTLPRPNQLSGVGRFPPDEWTPVFRDEAVEIVVRRSGRFGPLAAARLGPRP